MDRDAINNNIACKSARFFISTCVQGNEQVKSKMFLSKKHDSMIVTLSGFTQQT